MPRVDSVGKYADPLALVGEVKIEEGTYIQITRNDAHNSLVITDTRPTFAECGVDLSYSIAEDFAPSLPSPIITPSVA